MKNVTSEMDRKNKMDIKSFMKLLYDHEINKAIMFIEKTSLDEFNIVVAYLLKEIITTSNGNERNAIAYLLGEIKCQEATDVLMTLIFKEELRDNRGTLISALGKLECESYIYQLLPLLYEGNYEVVRNTHTLLQDHVPKLDVIEQKKCVNFIREKIDAHEKILTTLYGVYETIFGEELDD